MKFDGLGVTPQLVNFIVFPRVPVENMDQGGKIIHKDPLGLGFAFGMVWGDAQFGLDLPVDMVRERFGQGDIVRFANYKIIRRSVQAPQVQQVDMIAFFIQDRCNDEFVEGVFGCLFDGRFFFFGQALILFSLENVGYLFYKSMEIRAFRGQGIGKMKILLDAIDSTQSFASDLLKDSPVSHGTLVMARFQTQGRGRGAHSWEGECGKNFYGSLVLKHAWPTPPPPFALSQAAALAVRDRIESQTGMQVRLKWPNDVICAGKKVAGILISNQWKGASWESSILGIGINLNQAGFGEDNPDAASLATLTGKSIPVHEITNGLMDDLDRYYGFLLRGETSRLATDYYNHLHGSRSAVRMQRTGDKSTFLGQVVRLENDGKIWIRAGREALKSYDVDQIKFLLS